MIVTIVASQVKSNLKQPKPTCTLHQLYILCVFRLLWISSFSSSSFSSSSSLLYEVTRRDTFMTWNVLTNVHAIPSVLSFFSRLESFYLCLAWESSDRSFLSYPILSCPVLSWSGLSSVCWLVWYVFFFIYIYILL